MAVCVLSKKWRRPSDIATTARAYGVSLRTLRFYEQKGLLSPRRRGGTRIYNEADHALLELITAGKRLGFSLSAIRDLIDDRRNVVTETGRDTASSILDRLTSDQIQQQLQLLERQRADLQDAIDSLAEAAGAKSGFDGAEP